MIRFVARQENGNWYDFWLWEDNGQTNDPDFWVNLLAGATTVVAEIATAEVEADPDARPPIKYEPQGPWQQFPVTVENGRVRAVVGGMAKNNAYALRVVIDGVATEQFVVRIA
jgi:hypothetical protein